MIETDTDQLKVLITAGPTHEPIDAVRYLGNRSSGRLGLTLAEEAAKRGHQTTLLLGPTMSNTPVGSRYLLIRFQTTGDLQGLLREHWPRHDVLIMAAAVADFRPVIVESGLKIRRSESPLTLELEPTPDLLRDLGKLTQPRQTVIGFALEPEEGLLDAALEKLRRKGLDAIVANPLQTMEAETIQATLVLRNGRTLKPGETMTKPRFAAWFLDQLDEIRKQAGP